MDPETQRLFTVALIGLLLFFPVFNQVAQTAVDTLTKAEHEAQLADFFKNWDNIPDDRKIEYWDGRNPPPGHWENDGRHDDVRTRGGQGGSGTNGEGGPGEGEGENGEGTEETQQRVEYETVVLWSFEQNSSLQAAQRDNEELRQGDYHWVNITYEYTSFSGSAEFVLEAGGSEVWSLREGGDLPAISANDDGAAVRTEIGTTPLKIDYDYDPVGAQGSFQILITGTYPVTRSN